MTGSAQQDPSPSSARRKALREADRGSVMKIISSYPIEKYYDVADRLLASFNLAMDDRRLDDAYVYGIRFASFSIDSLPKHSDYKKRMFNTLRLRNAKYVEDVIRKMESVTSRMDAEELLLQQQREEEQRQEQQRIEQRQRTAKAHRQEDVERRAKAKLAVLMKQPPQTENASKEQHTRDDNGKSAEDSFLAKERQRLADQAEKLLNQQRALEADQEWETMKMLAREEHEDTLQQRRGDQEEQARVAKPPCVEQRPKNKHRRPRSDPKREPSTVTKSLKSVRKEKNTRERKVTSEPRKIVSRSMVADTSGSVSAIQPTLAVLPSSPLASHKPPGLRPEEERTINLLRSTIDRQEQRLQQTEEVQIPGLLRQAKTHLAAGDRKTALHVMARKKKLETQVDAWKGAVFTMETQILLLESAVEDREVAKAMKAASEAMESLQVDVSADSLDDMNRVMEEMATGAVVGDAIIMDEDELMEELEGGPSSKSNLKKDKEEDFQLDEFLLSLPSVPDADMPVAEEPEAEKKSGGLLSGWF